MTFHTLPDNEIEKIFAEDVLLIPEEQIFYKDGNMVWRIRTLEEVIINPFSNKNACFMGLEKLKGLETWKLTRLENVDMYEMYLCVDKQDIFTSAETLNKAIIEACIRIKRPDLSEDTPPKRGE